MNSEMVAGLSRMDNERLRGYKSLLDFYYGRQWDGKARRNERRLTFNYARVFIEKITSYLMSGVTFAVDPVDSTEKAAANARRAEAAISRVYGDNRLEQLDLETETDAAVLGDACYKVTWDGAEKRVRITAPDIQGIYAWWRGDDASRLWRIASRYQLSREEAAYLYG